MNGKFDEHRPRGDAQPFATDVDDAPPQFETLVERGARWCPESCGKSKSALPVPYSIA
jgi:hypothetical protein